MQKIIHFFDKLEDHVRTRLSHRSILYAFVGGIAVVLFWRGVWHTADLFPWLDGPVSILIGATTLLMTGLFVSSFIGDRILISGLKHEKKLTEKTEEEVGIESGMIDHIHEEVKAIRKIVEELQNKK